MKPGDRFGRLLVIEMLERAPPRRFLLCECDCGTRKRISNTSIISGTRSCGCLLTEKNQRRSTHGHAGSNKSREYTTWTAMRQRCLNPSHPSFGDYGGRGITICARWSLFENFLTDMGPRPPGGSIDRIDNEGSYTPENCRWATKTQQSQGRRRTLNYDRVNEARGRHEHGESLTSIAKRFGMSLSTISLAVRRITWSNVP